MIETIIQTDRRTIIRIKNAFKTWYARENKIDILSSIDLNVYTGESLAVMGPSGSGKSTLLHVLGLLTPMEKGTYFYDEKQLLMKDKKTVREVRDKIGFIFQDAKLIHDLNVLDNVCVPLVHRGLWPSRQRKLAVKALSNVGLGNHLYHKPNQLSGGELMRAAIARALVQSPRILLVDEPTGSLDTKTGDKISELLFEMVTQHTSMVFVTHHPPLAQMADRIVHLKDGKIE